MRGKKIAILGATGHIAKGLIDGFCREVAPLANAKDEISLHQRRDLCERYDLYERYYLFARSLERLGEFLANIQSNNVLPMEFAQFDSNEYDVIINCVGIGDPAKLKNVGTSIFSLTETYDNMILDYLQAHPDTLYINFSSGGAYGTDFSIPVEESTYAKIDINHITPSSFYAIAKINAEAKHRAMADKNIIDLRVFGYFSRFIDLNAQYFMSEVVSCVKNNRVLVTGQENITRDYVHPHDLISLIEKCIAKHRLNDVFDVYTQKPVTKFEILDYFSKEYGLKYTIKDNLKISSATGSKNHYYSENRKAEKLGYYPEFTSLDAVIEETKFLLGRVK